MELRSTTPNFYRDDLEKTIKELMGAYADLRDNLEFLLLGNLETDNVRELSADKITAGVIKATIELIGAIITGGTIRTDVEPNKRLELTKNLIRCYNSSNKLNGFCIDNDDAQFGDGTFYMSGIKALTFFNTITEGYAIMPRNGKPLSIGADGEITNFRGDLRFNGDTVFNSDFSLAEQSTAPTNEVGKIKLFYDGTDLKAMLPDGTVKTVTLT